MSNKSNWDSISSGFGCVSDESDFRRVVILGKTGSGKSSLGNTIFGEDKFTVCPGANSCQSPCQADTESLIGRKITLIDTPGFFDTNIPEEKLKAEISKCITECSPGPHAFLIVLELGRFTDQENDIIKKITEYFSEEVFGYATVVFTHGDQLSEGQNIKEYINDNTLLKEIVTKCGGRCHVVDNKYWPSYSDETYRSNAFQVKEIFKSIEEIVKQNNGNCYTNEFLQTVEKMIQREELAIVREEQPAIPEEQLIVHEHPAVLHEQPVVLPEEQAVVVVLPEQQQQQVAREGIREKAKRRVWEMLMSVGISTDVLLKALFGVVAVGAIAVACFTFRDFIKGIDAIQLVQSEGARISVAGVAVAAGALVTFKSSYQQ